MDAHPMNTVCRIEIAECVADAFTGDALSPADLIEFASIHGASAPLLATLSRLDAPGYRELRELWSELNDVPVER